MVQNDLKFFTNEPERDLYSRFAVILKNNTQFFDVLVGYFRTSGFFKMYPSLESVEKIRILVGLNVDRFTVHVIDRANEEIQFTSVSSTEGKEILEREVEKEFEQASTSSEVEKGVRTFIDWLKSGKLEMRMYTEAPIHAKVYIMRKDQDSDMYGSVITGSSNFSEAGLMNNLEFNVELKDTCDVQFALDKFEELWVKGTDIRDTYIETVEQRTWMRDDITPYQLYLKTLYEFFREEINSDKENLENLLPPGYIPLRYQRDAVLQAKKKLDAYNGVFISDVVGLGKTYICAMLAKTFSRSSHKLIICPPVLVDYWRGVLEEFGVVRYEVESLGKLDRVIENGTDKYSYVFIDEAHRFRNSDTDSYTKLWQICRGKKVILISATPINNYTSDIKSQIYLFQLSRSGTINGIKNIEGFFSSLESKLKKFSKDRDGYMKQLRENSEIIRDKLLREIMIRRTRDEIRQYYADDLAKHGMSFPQVGSPEKIIYEFDEEINVTFSKSIAIIKDFRYARYSPLLYLKDKEKYGSFETAQKNIKGFMKGLLVKRLESSFYAFRMTLGRFIESYENFIKMVRTKGKVYISKTVDVYDLLDNGDDAKLLDFIEKQDIAEYSITEFDPRFMRDLEQDLSDLQCLNDMWSVITDDPKLAKFQQELTSNPIMLGKKIVVFTESQETAVYLSENLKDIYGTRVVNFSGKSSAKLKSEIEGSFDPQCKDRENDKYDILITTDVLSEGVNLQRAGILVNYDLPWNPTKIMQRVGRINRVGTEYDRIYVFNFFPTAQSEKQIPLEERILTKLQAFHDTLGEDIKYLSEEEEVSPKKLFKDLNKDIDEEEESTNPELAYLSVIRQVRDNDPQLFKQVLRLPKKAKAGKKSELVEESATIGFIKKGALKTFFLSNRNQTKQLTFMEAIKYIKSEPEDSQISVGHEYYDHFDKNSEAFDDMLLEEETVSIEKPKLTGNDVKAVQLLKRLRDDPTMSDEQLEKIGFLINQWEVGGIPPKVSKDVANSKNMANDSMSLYFEIIKNVPPVCFEKRESVQNKVDEEKQVILSAYLKEIDS